MLTEYVTISYAVCPPLPTIDDPNITVIGSPLVGQHVTYSCSKGYMLQGDERTACVFNGVTAVWTDFDSPSCKGNKRNLILN